MRLCYMSLFTPVAILFMVTGCDSSPAPLSTSGYGTSSNAPYVHIDSTTKTVNFDITAAKTSNNNGFNFNGYSKGQLTITVPVNWHVKVTFSNESSAIPHSAEIVPFSQHANSSGFTEAFTGSATPKPMLGITKGESQSFSFTASESGKYALVCAVPGHSSDGLWDNFTVSSNVNSPSISTSDAASGTTGTSNGSGSYSSSSSGVGW
jgi:sulfocyanin